MATRGTAREREQHLEQLRALRLLVEEALHDSNALHHRLREIQLRLAQLSSSIETGNLAGVTDVS